MEFVTDLARERMLDPVLIVSVAAVSSVFLSGLAGRVVERWEERMPRRDR